MEPDCANVAPARPPGWGKTYTQSTGLNLMQIKRPSRGGINAGLADDRDPGAVPFGAVAPVELAKSAAKRAIAQRRARARRLRLAPCSNIRDGRRLGLRQIKRRGHPLAYLPPASGHRGPRVPVRTVSSPDWRRRIRSG